jgi:hypothetical protein
MASYEFSLLAPVEQERGRPPGAGALIIIFWIPIYTGSPLR